MSEPNLNQSVVRSENTLTQKQSTYFSVWFEKPWVSSFFWNQTSIIKVETKWTHLFTNSVCSSTVKSVWRKKHAHYLPFKKFCLRTQNTSLRNTPTISPALRIPQVITKRTFLLLLSADHPQLTYFHENSLSPPAACLLVCMSPGRGGPGLFYPGNGILIVRLQQEMEYVHRVPPCLPVAMLSSGLMGNSTGEQTGTSHFWNCLTFKHIWPHLYLSKCGLRPDLLFGWGPIQSHFLRLCQIIFVPTTVQMNMRRQDYNSRHVYWRFLHVLTSIFGVWNNAGEPKRWLNFIWTWFCIIACDYTRCFTSDEQTNLQTNLHVCKLFRGHQLWLRAETWRNAGHLMQH